jgi:hypothetical protein
MNNKERRLDIFLRNSVIRDWELFELKKPIKLVNNYRDIPVLANQVHSSIQQLRNYENILGQEKVKNHFKKEGIEYYYPELRLVIGRSPDIPIEQWRWLQATNNSSRLKIITYDDILKEMEARLSFYYSTDLF